MSILMLITIGKADITEKNLMLKVSESYRSNEN